MRRIFGKIMASLGEKDSKIVLITGDIGFKVFDEFREKFPDRFINIGICEQSMIGFAAGMSISGLKPWVYTITPFLIERPFEQVKLDIDQQNVDVKLVGYADYPSLGPTHSELDGKTITSVFKNINCYFPEDSDSTEKSVLDAYSKSGPAFISLKQDKKLSKSITSRS